MKKYLLNGSLLVVLSVVFYLVSLVLPAFYTKILHMGVWYIMDDTPEYGWQVLISGWGSLLLLIPAWSANITYYITLVAYCCGGKSLRLAIRCACLTFGIALTSPLYEEVLSFDLTIEHVSHFSSGFYCWLLSFILLIAACYCKRFSSSYKGS